MNFASESNIIVYNILRRLHARLPAANSEVPKSLLSHLGGIVEIAAIKDDGRGEALGYLRHIRGLEVLLFCADHQRIGADQRLILGAGEAELRIVGIQRLGGVHCLWVVGLHFRSRLPQRLH